MNNAIELDTDELFTWFKEENGHLGLADVREDMLEVLVMGDQVALRVDDKGANMVVQLSRAELHDLMTKLQHACRITEELGS